MIVSHSRKFIFVHLHKTGGTSVKSALLDFLDDGDVVIGAGNQSQASLPNLETSFQGLNKHCSAKQLRNFIDKQIWDRYFKFSVVRNPFDRLVSLHEFLNRVRRNTIARRKILGRLFSVFQSDAKLAAKDTTPWNWKSMKALLTTANFSEFIRSDFLDAAQDAKPQAHQLTDNGKLLVDFVGQFENLSSDWNQICSHVGIQADLGHENQSIRRHRNFRDYWKKDDEQFVADKYRLDFDLFGYSPSLHS